MNEQDQPQTDPVESEATATEPTEPGTKSRWARVRGAGRGTGEGLRRRPKAMLGAGALGLALVAGGGGFALGHATADHDAPSSSHADHDGDGFHGDRGPGGFRGASSGDLGSEGGAGTVTLS